MMAHSPGPWTFDDDRGRQYEQFHVCEDGCHVVLGTGSEALVSDQDDEDRAIANAHLIAAAPEMLSVLEALHVRLFREQGGREGSPWAAPLELIRATIAKARGTI